MINLSPVFYALAHILIGLFFCIGGVLNIKSRKNLLKEMKNKKIPFHQFVLGFGIGYELLFGFMLVFGFFIPFAAMMLIPFTVIAVCMFHNFWKFKGEKHQFNFAMFLTNMTATLSALLLLMCVM